jgi:hypothetical protein
LDRPVDTPGGVFKAAAFGVIEGLGMVVEVFLGPGWFEVALVGPPDAVPAVAAFGRRFAPLRTIRAKSSRRS